jgi:transposase
MTDRTPGVSRTSGGSAGRRPRRTFSPEYKHEAARLVTDTGRSTAEMAQKLGVGSQSLASGSPPNAPRRPVNRPESCPPPLDERAKLALPDKECVSDVKQAGWATTTCRGLGPEM